MHVATSLNGQAQTGREVARQGPAAHHDRAGGPRGALRDLHVPHAIRGARGASTIACSRVDKAEDGASFIDVFEWFRTEGYDEEECFQNTRRIFRGGVRRRRRALHEGRLLLQGHRPQLRVHPQRHPAQPRRAHPVPLRRQGRARGRAGPRARVNDGVVKPPHYLPPMFRDLNGLAIWMAYSTFFTQARRRRDQRLLREALRARGLSAARSRGSATAELRLALGDVGVEAFLRVGGGEELGLELALEGEALLEAHLHARSGRRA